jgi:hypothetical protein
LHHWFSSTAAVAAAALTVVGAATAPFYVDGPPPGRTGGFNETTCRECHRHNTLNDPAGSLTIDSLPAAYEPNRSYRLTVVLTRPGMLAAGFQLAVRTNDAGAQQAGLLAAVDDRTAFAAPAPRPIQYLQHTRKGTALTASDTARWTFTWRAPDGVRPVALHVAANAANDDNSDLGDFIYTREFVLLPHP